MQQQPLEVDRNRESPAPTGPLLYRMRIASRNGSPIPEDSEAYLQRKVSRSSEIH